MSVARITKASPQPKGKIPTSPDLRAEGKALREKTPRQAHAGWTPPPHRFDPLKVLEASNKGRVKELIPIRYGRMLQSPLAFFRGAASIMAADLAKTPNSTMCLQACGDCHLMNFGGYATPERRLIFDINDFDETAVAPWEWDIKRLATSFVLASRTYGHTVADARDAVLLCVESYRKAMDEFAELRALDIWYSRLDVETMLKGFGRQAQVLVRKQIAKARARNVAEHDVPSLVVNENGRPVIRDNPPLIFHSQRPNTKELQSQMVDAFHRYRKTLPDDRRVLLDRFELKDVALKVVGIGSVGTRCGIMLMMSGDRDSLFLQVKEARTSVLEAYAGKSRYKNHGERVVVGQRLMQSASDVFLGWTEGDQGNHYYIRQLHDTKIKLQVELFPAPTLATYAKFCGWVLARAHARSGQPSRISGYLGQSDEFDKALLAFSIAYADQTERDHQRLMLAARRGLIEVQLEGSA